MYLFINNTSPHILWQCLRDVYPLSYHVSPRLPCLQLVHDSGEMQELQFTGQYVISILAIVSFLHGTTSINNLYSPPRTGNTCHSCRTNCTIPTSYCALPCILGNAVTQFCWQVDPYFSGLHSIQLVSEVHRRQFQGTLRMRCLRACCTCALADRSCY